MGEKYKALPKAINNIIQNNDPITFDQCILLCIFIALILFLVYCTVWYIGGKNNE